MENQGEKSSRYSKGQQWTTNIILEGDGKRARLWANVLLVIPGDPVPYVSVIGKVRRPSGEDRRSMNVRAASAARPW